MKCCVTRCPNRAEVEVRFAPDGRRWHAYCAWHAHRRRGVLVWEPWQIIEHREVDNPSRVG